MLGLANEGFRVYECYDEYTCDPVTGKQKPGAWAREQALLSEVDLVFATSSRLFRSRRRHHRQVHYAPNGVPFRAFSEDVPLHDDPLHAIPRPILMSMGEITEESLDPQLLLGLASRGSDWSFVFVGPRDPSPSAALNALFALSNVRQVPPVSHERLPSLIAKADVALVPYKLHDYAHARNPLKIWEYMAVGKPIVGTAMEELVRLSSVVRIGHSQEDFAEQIQASLYESAEQRLKRQRLGRLWAAQHDWDRLTARMLRIIEAIRPHKV